MEVTIIYMLIIDLGYGEYSQFDCNTLDECYRIAEEDAFGCHEVEFQIVEIVTESLSWDKKDFVARKIQVFFESFM